MWTLYGFQLNRTICKKAFLRQFGFSKPKYGVNMESVYISECSQYQTIFRSYHSFHYVSQTFALCCVLYQGFPGGAVVKNLLPMQEMWIPSPGRQDPLELLLLFSCSVVSHPLEQEMATHSGILACEIPRTEECGGLQSTLLDMTE